MTLADTKNIKESFIYNLAMKPVTLKSFIFTYKPILVFCRDCKHSST